MTKAPVRQVRLLSRASAGGAPRVPGAGLALILGAAILLPGAAEAACASKAAPSYVAEFMTNPRGLIARHPNGGDELAFEINALVVAKVETLAAVEAVVPSATRPQRAAIGQGLARAKASCLSGTFPLPRRVDDVVRRIADRDVTRGFAALTIDDEPRAQPPALTTEAPPEEPRRSLGLNGPLAAPGSTKLSDPFAPLPIR